MAKVTEQIRKSRYLRKPALSSVREKAAGKVARYCKDREKDNVHLQTGDRPTNPYHLLRDEEFIKWLVERAVRYLQDGV